MKRHCLCRIIELMSISIFCERVSTPKFNVTLSFEWFSDIFFLRISIEAHRKFNCAAEKNKRMLAHELEDSVECRISSENYW